MKKVLLIALAAAGMMTANAQTKTFEATNFGSNWSLGLHGGATTTLNSQAYNASGFWQNMRGLVGINLQKQISPTFGLGIDASWGINTSYTHSSCAFDTQYLGVYGAANLMNLFGGYNCNGRFFEIEAVAGAGWGHYFQSHGRDYNWFETKAGLNFNFNVTKQLTLALKPSVSFNMTGGPELPLHHTSCYYNADYGKFNLEVGVTYHFGKGFECVNAYTQSDIDALNATINGLQGQLAVCQGNLDNCAGQLAACGSENARLKAELDACNKRGPQVETKTQVVEKVSTNLESVRYIYFANASSAISADQMRTVDIISTFMKNHPESKLDIKGYASPEGNLDFNIKLAQARAESVKNSLVKKYGIKAGRIEAQGEGIGNMFTEPSWNRVAICTLDK